jgi:hypothetical protein
VRDRFQAETAPPGLRRALVRAAARDDESAPESAYAFDELQAALRAAQAAVAEIFGRHCPEAEPHEDRAPK